MKKILLIIPVIALAMGCHDYKADINQLQKEKQDLAQAVTYKDSTITDFLNSMNQIETNLSTIDKKQMVVAEATQQNELKKSQVDRINDNIRDINELMKENKARIAELSKKLKGSNGKLTGLEKMIASLNAQVAEKDQQLAMLNDKIKEMTGTVDKLNTDVSTLTAESTSRQQTIDNQTAQLHTAYFTVGTYKELQQKQVVTKEGGFLGLGKQKKVKQNFNSDAFTTIDYTKTASIPLEAKDAVVLTNHPTDSYTVEHKGKGVDAIQITNPDKFWKASKYLVVVVDK